MNLRQQRQARLYQAKHRGSKASHVTDLEDALLMLLWEAEILSAGQVAEIMDTDLLTIRHRRQELLEKGYALAEQLSPEAAHGITPKEQA